MLSPYRFFFFFFNDTATTEIYTLSLHDALPICLFRLDDRHFAFRRFQRAPGLDDALRMALPHGVHVLVGDRKSTRLNSSHGYISYAVFCLKKKKKIPLCSHSSVDRSLRAISQRY